MPGHFANERCIFCTEPSSPTGEHVLDTWALKMFPQKVDEYSLYKSNEPVLDRDGVPRQDDNVARAKRPMCIPYWIERGGVGGGGGSGSTRIRKPLPPRLIDLC